MKKWTKEEALKTLKRLALEADSLRNSQALSTEHTVWVAECLDTLEEIFGLASRYYVSFGAIEWGNIPSGTIVQGFGSGLQADIESKRHNFFIRDLGVAKGLLLGGINYLKNREITDVYIEEKSGAEASLVLSVLNIAEQKLRKIIRDKPEKEKQVQDAFESLLVGADIQYRREEDSIEYSSKTYIPDFSLKEIDLAVEIKLSSRSEREKELPKEINDDILAYKKKYKNLIFVVYDLGFIRDIDRFCGSFEEHENVTVRVIKH